MLLSELWRHHGVETKEQVNDEADQNTLAATLGVDQSTVSRAFKKLGELLPRKWSQTLNETQSGNKRKSNKEWYVLACKLEVIHEVLKHMDRPKSREYYRSDLSNVADRERNDSDDTGE
ncbi:MAG: hypothetical protein KatS3mg105_4910 [Gemmatales bacterium]|nr:MAG: hypothetical protein KatS3mg105_4910 [Gemmatales bacterium]